MSKLVDYSKFDNIIDSDDESDTNHAVAARQSASASSAVSAIAPSPTTSPTAASAGVTRKHPSQPSRYIFTHSDRKIYEWEQSLDDVTVYIDAPPSLPSASCVIVDLSPNRLKVGLKDHDRYFIDERTYDKVVTRESSWYLDDGVITIVLIKAFRGQTWEGVLRGDNVNDSATNNSRRGITEQIDPMVKQEMQRSMMLERFQEENPGFDFRDAEFNGEVPDPRSFMGGVGYTK